MNRRELPLLGAVAGFLRWCEELLIIVSGPLLTVGLGIALVDLLTGGALLAAQPELLYAWAISQAAGVDAQLVASAAKLAAAVHARRYWMAAGYGVLIVPLAYVGFLASNVFATQQSQGLTTAEALARLGMDGTSWIVQRSALAVALVVLSGLLRYRPSAAEASAEDERERLERELTLEPLRAAPRSQGARLARPSGCHHARGRGDRRRIVPYARTGRRWRVRNRRDGYKLRPSRQCHYRCTASGRRGSRRNVHQRGRGRLPPAAGVRTGVLRVQIVPKSCGWRRRQSGSARAGEKRLRRVRTAAGYVPPGSGLPRVPPPPPSSRRLAQHGSRG